MLSESKKENFLKNNSYKQKYSSLIYNTTYNKKEKN
jgi:hypothetical protein